MIREPKPGGKVEIRALSPVVVSRKTEADRQEQYLAPGNSDYQMLFFKNLIDKHHTWQRQTGREPTRFATDELHFRCITEKPKSRLQTIKAFTVDEVKVRGFLFDFRIIAPPELLQTGLSAGFGAMNALGFGCGEVININNNT